MDAPLVLARFWGILLVVLCGSILIYSKHYVRMVKGFQNEATRVLYFLVILTIGAVNVAVLNQWRWDYKGLITVLGWGSVLKGCFGLLMPDFYMGIIQKVTLRPIVIYALGLVFFIVGCYLLFVGFR